jgi:hypothetical protein
MLLRYETLTECMTEFVLLVILLGLAGFVIVSAMQMVKNRGPPR